MGAEKADKNVVEKLVSCTCLLMRQLHQQIQTTFYLLVFSPYQDSSHLSKKHHHVSHIVVDCIFLHCTTQRRATRLLNFDWQFLSTTFRQVIMRQTQWSHKHESLRHAIFFNVGQNLIGDNEMFIEE